MLQKMIRAEGVRQRFHELEALVEDDEVVEEVVEVVVAEEASGLEGDPLADVDSGLLAELLRNLKFQFFIVNFFVELSVDLLVDCFSFQPSRWLFDAFLFGLLRIVRCLLYLRKRCFFLRLTPFGNTLVIVNFVLKVRRLSMNFNIRNLLLHQSLRCLLFGCFGLVFFSNQ